MTIGQGVLFTLVMIIGVTLTHVHTLYFLLCNYIRHNDNWARYIVYTCYADRCNTYPRTPYTYTYTPQKNAKKIDMND